MSGILREKALKILEKRTLGKLKEDNRKTHSEVRASFPSSEHGARGVWQIHANNRM
jgi:hypothetical protein